MYHKESKHVSVIVFISYFLEGFSDLGQTGFIVSLTCTHRSQCEQSKWVKEVGLISLLPSSRKQIRQVSNREFHCFQSSNLKKKLCLKVDKYSKFLEMKGYFFRNEKYIS